MKKLISLIIGSLLISGSCLAMGRDLFQAAIAGDAASVEALLLSGVDPNVVNLEGETPLHWACEIDMPSQMICELAGETHLPVMIIRDLIVADFPNEVWGVINPYDPKLPNLYSEFSDFFARHHIELPDSPARQAIVNALIQAGADVNKQSANKNIPLHYAAHYPMPKIMQSLVAVGADINRMNAKGKTPLNVAISPEIINVLDRIQHYPEVAHNQLVTLLSAGHPRCGQKSLAQLVFHANSEVSRIIAPFIRRAAFEDALYGHHEA